MNQNKIVACKHKTCHLKWLLEQHTALQIWFKKHWKLIWYFVLYITVPQWAMAKKHGCSNLALFISILLFIYGIHVFLFIDNG